MPIALGRPENGQRVTDHSIQTLDHTIGLRVMTSGAVKGDTKVMVIIAGKLTADIQTSVCEYFLKETEF